MITLGCDGEMDLELEICSTLTGTVRMSGEPVPDLRLALRDEKGHLLVARIADDLDQGHSGRIPAGNA
ncbi:hypothetical protein OG439_24440 [Amycolatopsis sp. NBC_01307]|uniref:hypothetical protein n=1 Tax=Amycolatopsis sp. NBC_01307 TaxID=2903561 RepID=UPI002E0DD59F|nr:hypothetical protein OG439_24440 [Amycolatopsis sp. NBC_01307]